jgi:hypothetical protein
MLRYQAFLLGIVLLFTGCSSGRGTISGKVTYPDGSPLEAGTVIGEATIDGQIVAVQGNVGKDGSFRMGVLRAGDGTLPGSYRFLVMPVALGDSEIAEGKLPGVEGKYSRFESSGITLDVKPGDNVLNITVTRPTPRKK